MVKQPTAPMLYAMSQGIECKGLEECHWCLSPCTRDAIHDEPPNVPFVKNREMAKKFMSPYVCRGCWLFRRTRITIPFLKEGYKDTQSPRKHSWYITEKGAWAITEEDKQSLYRLLLNPPESFVLSLLADNSMINHLHVAEANDLVLPLKGNTVLKFTLNNVIHRYLYTI